MSLGIVIPLILIPLVVIGVFVWYRRSMAELRVDDEQRAPSGTRLTAESLHRLPAPWRVVHEVGRSLGDVDHVVVGPPGVVAIATVVSDRPPVEQVRNASSPAHLTAQAAVARGPVDELARHAQQACDLFARVHWGAPVPQQPPGEVLAPGFVLVEGQRIIDWLDGLGHDAVAPLSPSDIDRTWQAIVVGIGRPDPLA